MKLIFLRLRTKILVNRVAKDIKRPNKTGIRDLNTFESELRFYSRMTTY